MGFALIAALAVSCQEKRDAAPALPVETYAVTGTVREVKLEERKLIVKHLPVPGYMDAMTMPFRVRRTNELARLGAGDEITFKLHVTEEESWIDGVVKTGHSPTAPAPVPVATDVPAPPGPGGHALRDYKFTNEFGQPVSLNDFRGRALAYTFIFTRCPIPEYCPRLSRNFADAARKIRGTVNAPTNWHFISFTIDPEFDTPAVLQRYARTYGYDSNHWSFLTGPTNRIGELAQLSGATWRMVDGSLSHNFRTLIVDPQGRLQRIIPTSGDLSDALADDLIQFARNTTPPAPATPSAGGTTTNAPKPSPPATSGQIEDVKR